MCSPCFAALFGLPRNPPPAAARGHDGGGLRDEAEEDRLGADRTEDQGKLCRGD